MALTVGTRLGPYEIESAIGAGGMGEVYKARDTRLNRKVALKVLPEHVAADPRLKQRFESEAQTLASLSHPHICPVFDVGQQDGVDFLVMEYLEGETLAQRLSKGALPLDRALQYAIEIADALDKAHRQGIVHRDLKPGNIMLTKSGTKLLDFGLAKLNVAAVSALSALPTQDSPMTTPGTILGTLQYMAPEQLESHDADARTDIFAFGAVLYEMVTGRKAFEGKSQASLIGAILKDEPRPLSTLQPTAPPALDRVVKKCLAKGPDTRWHSAHDLHDELQWIAEASSQVGVPAPAVAASERAERRRALPVALGALVVGATAASVAVWFATRPAPPPSVRTEIVTFGRAALSINGNDRDLAITPDGSRIVYRGNGQLLVRALDRLDPDVLSDLGAPRGIFVSPDGRWVGFFDGLIALKKVAITGGPPVMITKGDGSAPRGATWGSDGTVVYATSTPATGLQRVSAAGGNPTVLTKPNPDRGEGDHVWPEFLPGSQEVLFTITAATGGLDNAQIAVLDPATGTYKVVVRGGYHAHYVQTGHLVYGAGGTLRAAKFDRDRLAVVGPPVPVLERVVTTPFGAVEATVAATGTLVYVPGGVAGAARSLVWVDRMGREEPVPVPVRAYVYPRISPDGTRVAIDVRDQEQDIWIWHLAQQTLTRFTFDSANDFYPVWSPDNRRVLFVSDRGGMFNLYWQAADGSGSLERLPMDDGPSFFGVPYAMTPDGSRIVVSSEQEGLMLMPVQPPRRLLPLVQTTFPVRNAELAPNGRWLAYESTESGREEIYVRPFPDVTGGRWQVSTGGGRMPLWARNGQELFYVAPDGRLMGVRVESGSSWRSSMPARILEGQYFLTGPGRTFDISPDSRRFLMVKQGGGKEAAPQNLVIVQNWTEELKRLVPTN